MYKRSISGNQLWDSIIFLITQPQVFRVVLRGSHSNICPYHQSKLVVLKIGYAKFLSKLMNYNHRFLYLEYNTCIIFMYIHICLYAQHLDSSTSVPQAIMQNESSKDNHPPQKKSENHPKTMLPKTILRFLACCFLRLMDISLQTCSKINKQKSPNHPISGPSISKQILPQSWHHDLFEGLGPLPKTLQRAGRQFRWFSLCHSEHHGINGHFMHCTYPLVN